MAIDTVNGVSGNYNAGTSAAAKTGSSQKTGAAAGSNLGKDEFLQILVSQLRNQDPLSPMEDKDFIAQMAQFSVLEEMQNMNSMSGFSQACTLVGKNVFATVANADGSSKDIFGMVTSAQTIDGTPYLNVGDTLIPYTSDIIVYQQPEPEVKAAI